TSRSTNGACSRARTLRTASPESFMKVNGLTSSMSRPRKRPWTTELASRVRPRPDQPARSAIRSSTIQPALWRVFAYWLPGLPRPTTIFTDAPWHAEGAQTVLGGPRPDGISVVPPGPGPERASVRGRRRMPGSPAVPAPRPEPADRAGGSLEPRDRIGAAADLDGVKIEGPSQPLHFVSSSAGDRRQDTLDRA